MSTAAAPGRFAPPRKGPLWTLGLGGLIVGPLVAGGAIDLFGYRTLWPICGALVLSAVPLVLSLARGGTGR